MIFAEFDIVVVYFTIFIIIVTISNLLNRLGEAKRTRVEEIFNDDDYENQDKMNNEIYLLKEFYSAADKCFIKEYAEKCKKLGADRPSLINVKFPSTGQTPFHRVCFHGEASLIEFLLKKGADPRLESNAGESPICFAMCYYLHKNDLGENEPLECLEILRRAGCVLKANTIWYDILLKKSLRRNKKSLTIWLLVNCGHRTPYHMN